MRSSWVAIGLLLLTQPACDKAADRTPVEAGLDQLPSADQRLDVPGDTVGHDGSPPDLATHDGAEVCQGVACSSKGTCVPVEGQPTCACSSGTYRVGLACLEDPCLNGGTCYYVDSATGVDNNPGSKAKPWKTLSRVQQALSTLQPGDYVLFRRGGDWSGPTFAISGVKGNATQPVTLGAYGPSSAARPRLSKMTVKGSSYITVRDFEVSFNPANPCIAANYTDHVIIQDTLVHDCTNNGIAMHENTSYTVMVDNLVYNVTHNDALSIHESSVVTSAIKVGDHHWIVDNRVYGPVGEEPVDVATGSDDQPGARDIKIVGNRLSSGRSGCIVTGHGTSVVWILGNLLGNCPTARTSKALGVGGNHGKNSGTQFQVRGNVVFWNLMSAGTVISEAPQVVEATFEQNTFITAVGERTVFAGVYPAGKLNFNRNIVWTTGAQAHVAFDGTAQASVASMDDNWYVPATKPGCTIDGADLAAWQSSTGFDKGSSCANVPGLALPTETEVKDFAGWTKASFLDKFIPDSSWPGCAKQIGAFDCKGKLRVQFKPIAGYSDSNGYGWEGPLIVKQRYPLP